MPDMTPIPVADPEYYTLNTQGQLVGHVDKARAIEVAKAAARDNPGCSQRVFRVDAKFVADLQVREINGHG